MLTGLVSFLNIQRIITALVPVTAGVNTENYYYIIIVLIDIRVIKLCRVYSSTLQSVLYCVYMTI